MPGKCVICQAPENLRESAVDTLTAHITRRLATAGTLAALALALARPAFSAEAWEAVAARARGQNVYWNAWGGDGRTNAFIDWAAGQVQAQYGITLRHVKLTDTSEAVTRVIAEKTAGNDTNGSVDLIWINGPNFLSMKSLGLLFGPFADQLPNMRYLDTDAKLSNTIDFTTPVEGMAAPWRLAQFVFVCDGARVPRPPRSMADFLVWARANPGRFTHPDVRDYIGATFIKQALLELAPDPALLQQPVTEAAFAAASAPLWAWYDALRPLLWRGGALFPASGPAERQLLADSEIDIALSFDPAEAAASVKSGLLPAGTRVFGLPGGTIGNTSFVAIPYNSPHADAAMLVANFLLEPATQAHAQDIAVLGSYSVLDLAKLSPAQQQLFAGLPADPALPANAELGKVLGEPHASWMTRLTQDWVSRYAH